MADYKKMYFTLFNKVTDAIDMLEDTGDIKLKKVSDAIEILKDAQIECEDIYIDTDEDDEGKS